MIYGAMALVTDCVVPWQQVLTMTDADGTLVKWHTGAVLDLAMGKVGVCFVALAVCMGIFTGMNGFFMTSSRLLFGMARAKMLPSAFEKVHPEHKTPSICVGFTMIICCICPFFGREVIGWVVDMCSVGTAFGYFFTCAGAYILLKKYGDDTDTNKIHPAVAMGGCVISVVILLLLIVPGSPAFMPRDAGWGDSPREQSSICQQLIHRPERFRRRTQSCCRGYKIRSLHTYEFHPPLKIVPPEK